MRHKSTLLFVTGSGPGLGKSTLAESLATALRLGGISVHLFREMDIEHHPAFSAVIGEFLDTGEVSRTTLLVAAGDYLKEMAANDAEVVVLDALFAYLPSLLAWGDTDQEILEFMVDISGLFSEFSVVEIHLTGDLKAALIRAGTREGADWLALQVKKISGYRNAPPIATPDEAAAYLDVLARRALLLLEQAPWEVVVVEADQDVDRVHSQALEALRPLLRLE